MKIEHDGREILIEVARPFQQSASDYAEGVHRDISSMSEDEVRAYAYCITVFILANGLSGALLMGLPRTELARDGLLLAAATLIKPERLEEVLGMIHKSYEETSSQDRLNSELKSSGDEFMRMLGRLSQQPSKPNEES